VPVASSREKKCRGLEPLLRGDRLTENTFEKGVSRCKQRIFEVSLS
jgi:hypothetical protein